MSKIQSTDAIKAGDNLRAFSHCLSTTNIVLGAMASRDWRPMHHDRDFAIERSGLKDIILNSPSQAAWFERYISDFCGSTMRLKRLSLKMKKSLYPGDTLVFSGAVTNTQTVINEQYASIDLSLLIRVNDTVATECAATAVVALGDNQSPWLLGWADWETLIF